MAGENSKRGRRTKIQRDIKKRKVEKERGKKRHDKVRIENDWYTREKQVRKKCIDSQREREFLKKDQMK